MTVEEYKKQIEGIVEGLEKKGYSLNRERNRLKRASKIETLNKLYEDLSYIE